MTYSRPSKVQYIQNKHPSFASWVLHHLHNSDYCHDKKCTFKKTHYITICFPIIQPRRLNGSVWGGQMPTMEIGERPFSSLPQCLLSAYTHIFHLYHHLPPSPSPLPFPRVSDLVFSHFLSMHSYIPSPIPAPSLLKAPKVKIPPTKPPHNIHPYIPSLPSSPPFSFSPPFT